MRRRAGFTLAELLVVAFLSGVVLFLIAQLLVPSLLLFRLESARTEVQQTTLMVVQRLQRQLMNAALESVTVISEPPAVAFQEVPEQDSFEVSSGRPRMSNYYVLYWYDAKTRRVLSKQWPPKPPDIPGYDFAEPFEPRPLPEGHLKAILLQSNGTERVVAREVDSFVVTDDDGDPEPMHPPLVVTLTCSADASGGGGAERKETYSMTTRILCRNGRW